MHTLQLFLIGGGLVAGFGRTELSDEVTYAPPTEMNAVPLESLRRRADALVDPALRAAFVRAVQAEANGRYAFAKNADYAGLGAAHPRQDLRIGIHDGCVALTDRAGGQGLTLLLSRLNGEHVAPAETHVDGTRVELRRGTLTEWYAHGRLGVEQGFTLAQAPCGGSRLRLELTVNASGYTAETRADGTLEFSRGARVLAVRDLYAYDAEGRTLPSRMVWAEGVLRLEVDAEDARYPVVIDPMWTEQPKLTADDGAEGDCFGRSVSLCGDTALVSAYGDDDQAGSVYVFVRSGSNWTREAILTPSDPAKALFGMSVSLSGDTALVGAPRDRKQVGAAYVFVRTGTTWTEQKRLTATDGAPGDYFGASVSVSGDTALVGAVWGGSAYVFARRGCEWVEEKILKGNGDFGCSVSLSGDTALVGARLADAAYVFRRSGFDWPLEETLTASDARATAFGCSVSLSDDTALVGARDEDAGASSSGSAYVFVRSRSAWTRQQRLTASDPAWDAHFGFSVSVSEDTALVGAVNAHAARGSAYVFVRSGITWAQQEILSASDGAPGDDFGVSVSVLGDTALVGAFFDDDAGSNSGSVYAFVRTNDGAS